MLQQGSEILSATTKTRCSQINQTFFKEKEEMTHPPLMDVLHNLKVHPFKMLESYISREQGVRSLETENESPTSWWSVNTGDAEGTQATILFHLPSKKGPVPFSPGGAHGTKGSVAGSR